MTFKKPDARDIDAFISMLSPERVIFGSAISEDYSRDEMTEYGCFMPDAVLLPENADEISKALSYCNANMIAVTPRGAGTGLCGGCVAKFGGVVISTERMKKLIEIDKANMTARVEPGLLLMEFQQALEGTGLFYPPDPGEKSATVGGNVMTNAGGMRAVRYGVTRDYVLGMKAVLANGDIIDLGGKTVKTSSGYNIMQLLCGSEGTLCFLAEITLKLIAEPLCNVSLLAPFNDLSLCVSAVPSVLTCGCQPTAVEFIEREVISDSEKYLGKQFPDRDADAYLLVRIDSSDDSSLDKAVNILADTLLACGANDVLMADTDERKASVWDARGAFLEAIKGGTPSMDECDVVVPRLKIAEFAKAAKLIGENHGVRIRLFGHAGDGNLHIYACQDDLAVPEWRSRAKAVMDELYALSRELGGQISGEHGVGHAKSEYLTQSVGETQIELMRGIKRAFDPNGILNPGKVI